LLYDAYGGWARRVVKVLRHGFEKGEGVGKEEASGGPRGSAHGRGEQLGGVEGAQSKGRG